MYPISAISSDSLLTEFYSVSKGEIKVHICLHLVGTTLKLLHNLLIGIQFIDISQGIIKGTVIKVTYEMNSIFIF